MPSGIYGGTELLFARMSSNLTGQYQVFILVSDECLIGKLPISHNITVVKKSDINDKIFDQVIISAKDIILFYEHNVCFKNILIWQLQPDELCAPILKYINRIRNLNIGLGKISRILISALYNKRKLLLIKFIKNTMNNSSLVFMDKTNYETTCNWVNTKLENPSYVPIASKNREKQNILEKQETLPIEILITSRISFDFKYYPIYCFIENLSKVKNSITLHVIGDGEALDTLKENICKIASSNINIKFYGFMENENIFKNIYPIIDLTAGMGTSVLDSSSVGIPTIIMDAHSSYINSRKIKYSWSFEQEGYSVGEYITTSKSKSHTLSDMINQLYENKVDISEKTYNYYVRNHSEESVLSKLLFSLENGKKLDSDYYNSTIKKIMSSNHLSEQVISKILSFFRFFKK